MNEQEFSVRLTIIDDISENKLGGRNAKSVLLEWYNNIKTTPNMESLTDILIETFNSIKPDTTYVEICEQLFVN